MRCAGALARSSGPASSTRLIRSGASTRTVAVTRSATGADGLWLLGKLATGDVLCAIKISATEKLMADGYRRVYHLYKQCIYPVPVRDNGKRGAYALRS